ncbi:MAG: hypothetical protein IID40_11545, partial [Planctomycetes bacterium]|nr:hypothetical protein [Planctomycetota bacterium]
MTRTFDRLGQGRVSFVVGWALLALAVAAAPSAMAATGQTPTVASPLRLANTSPGDSVTPLTFDPAAYARALTADTLVLRDFVLDAQRRVDLELHQVHILSADARLVVGTADGDVPMERPDMLLLSGTVSGRADSWVFLSLSPQGSNGYVELGDETFIISSGPNGFGRATVIYNPATVPAGSINLHDLACGTDLLEQLNPIEPDGPNSPTQGGPRGSTGCGVANIAVETDWEFTGSLFSGDTNLSAAYALSLMAAVSEIYNRDVGVQFNISFLRVWSDSNDPWTTNDAIQQLYQFANYWNANMPTVSRHVAHFLSGRSLASAGGVAFLNGLCSPTVGYALSAHLNGFFPYPLLDNNWQNWDPFVVAHEMGHNFGTPHTHDLNPPIDGCAWGDCSVTPNGTIMSYCHTCPGGLSNILLQFHQRIIDEEIVPYLEFQAPCDLLAYPPTISVQPVDNQKCVVDAFGFSVSADA